MRVCHITVLTGQPNYPMGEVFDGYHAGGVKVQQHELGYSIYRVPLVLGAGWRNWVGCQLSFLCAECQCAGLLVAA